MNCHDLSSVMWEKEMGQLCGGWQKSLGFKVFTCCSCDSLGTLVSSHIHVRLIGDCKLAIGMNLSVNGLFL